MDADLVRALLADQHPDLAGLEVSFLAEGWDTTSWRVGEALVARLPRRDVAVEGLRNEQRWLGRLAPALPLPIPAPVRVGTAGRGFPWTWSVVPYLGGTPALGGAVVDGPRVAASLATFLRALHAPAPADAPSSPFRGVPLADRVDGFAQRCDELDGAVDVGAARRAFARGLAAAPHRAPVWVHGDPHPGNLLLRDGDLVGVLDFIDLTRGDPATDLAGAWLLLEPADAALVLAHYGADADLVARARAWAALFAVLFLEIGLDDDGAEYGAIGGAALARLRASEAEEERART